ncbi:type I-E CRISPR-associated protein Cse1/CasA [Streptomyces sp. NPDC093675]|uniref:type I-E CRISPR-associated protein Cse1/CasA n=1 Tax=Streptomyces sp. NPDC093675 TaxID=3366049 RepID=UPI00380E50F3
MPAPLYPTDTEPCIPVLLLNGRHQYLGFRDVLLRAHTIEDLALPLPPAASAVLRLLTVFTARVTGLDDPEMGAGEWAARRRALLKEPDGFDAGAVHAYFDRYTWDLFHPARPFLQDPRLAEQCEKRAGVNKLVFGRPEGDNLAWLSPHSDIDPQPVPTERALWHMLIHHYYGAGGQCSARTVGGRSTSSAKTGPLRSTISFHPLGRTLYETLLAGLPKPNDPWPGTEDRCPWEEPLPDPRAAPPPVTWPGRLLTGRSRHAVLLIPSPDGRHVTDAYLTWATEQTLPAIDPYLIHHVDQKRPVTQRHTPRLADADRALWRDLDTLLLAGDEEAAVQRPEAFTTLNDLPPEVRTSLRARVHAFDQDKMMTLSRTWYTALTPPIWPWVQENDPQAAERIAACRTAAEKVGSLLAKVSKEAWRKATTPASSQNSKPPKRQPAWARRASADYWARAEATFWRLLDDPARDPSAAFTADAVAVLRTATRPAIARQFRTARAVAEAVAELRRRS